MFLYKLQRNCIAKLQKRLVFEWSLNFLEKVIKTRINKKLPKVAKTRCVQRHIFQKLVRQIVDVKVKIQLDESI